MTHSHAVPSFTELTADLPQMAKPSAKSFMAARRAWITHVEQECARLTKEYQAGNVFMKFNFGQIYEIADVEFAQKYAIDYFGLCLILNEQYEKSPFADENAAQRKKWFDCHYITETRLKGKTCEHVANDLIDQTTVNGLNPISSLIKGKIMPG